MTKPAVTLGGVEPSDLSPTDACHRSDDELSDAVARFDLNRSVTQVDEQDLHLCPIIGVYRSRRVQDGEAVAQGESAAGTNLGLVILRQGQGRIRSESHTVGEAQGQRFP